MAEEPLKKIGRGGAGNFWSKKDQEDAEKREREDLEAQPSSGTAPLTRTTTAQSEYSRSGRGGAGNLVLAAEAAASLPLTKVPTVSKKDPAAFPGHIGRGGAGNWRVNIDEERRQQEEAERDARSRVDEQVRVEVEMELQPPPKAYRASGVGNVRD